jgi:hypothetical protein
MKGSPDVDIKLIVMPTDKEGHHSPFLHAISQFAHDMLDYEPNCPVVSVVPRSCKGTGKTRIEIKDGHAACGMAVLLFLEINEPGERANKT